MEQAHYLLNRLRANNDGIQTKAPTQDDLNPNAVNAVRLQALQTTLNASAAVNSVTGTQNQIALQQYGKNTSRHDALVSQADALQAKLYQDQLTLGNLQGEQNRLQAIQTANAAKTPPVTDATVTQQLGTISGRIAALTAQDNATSSQITALTTAAGSDPSAPSLSTVTPPTTLSAPSKILGDATTSLLNKTVDSFDGPKLQASIALDNFLQMQYEIVAKQLTTLRDEVDAHRRILFLEMPTSIESADHRIFGTGGEDKLAQSWWRVTKIYQRYKIEESPCWQVSEFDDQELRYAGRWDVVKGDSETPLTQIETASNGLKTAYQGLENSFRDIDLNAVHQASDLTSLETSVQKAATDIRDLRNQLRTSREQFMRVSDAIEVGDAEKRENLAGVIPAAEAACRQISETTFAGGQPLRDLSTKVSAALKTAKSDPKQGNADALTKLQGLIETAQKIRRNELNDELRLQQANIYKDLGGPRGMLRAFSTDIEREWTERNTFGGGSDVVRAVDLIPSQTALNVNTGHALVRNSALSFAWNTLFSFGLKVDYQRQQENYDQFMQQESFSSSFGKGQATFGWTFGPLPGSRIINSGDRTTYAVLEVPDDTTYLAVEGFGCAFHRKNDPPRIFPGDLDGPNRSDEYHCGNPLKAELRVPDRMNSGGFWLSGVDYAAADPGKTASVILRGGYFSPQTTILVNGRRIPQVLGVGKPLLNMDFGEADPADDTAVSGTFEYVNQEQLTLNLAIPSTYTGPDFPIVTVVAPSRSMIINSLPDLLINRTWGSLEDASLVTKKPKPPDPTLTITGWQYFGGTGKQFSALLTGQKLTDLAKLRLNGIECDKPEPLKDSLAQISCTAPADAQWEFVGMSATADASKRDVSTWTVQNPRLISISSFQAVDGVEYGDDGKPTSVPVQLTGTGFTPQTVLGSDIAKSGRVTLSYVSPTQLNCIIRNPLGIETIIVSDPARQGTAAIVVPRPADHKAADEPPAKETTTTTTKKIVKN